MRTLNWPKLPTRPLCVTVHRMQRFFNWYIKKIFFGTEINIFGTEINIFGTGINIFGTEIIIFCTEIIM